MVSRHGGEHFPQDDCGLGSLPARHSALSDMRILHERLAEHCSSALHGEAQVHRYPVQPCGELRPASELAKVLPGPDESLLLGVRGILQVSKDSICKRVHPLLVQRDEFVEGLDVPALRRLHQFLV